MPLKNEGRKFCILAVWFISIHLSIRHISKHLLRSTVLAIQWRSLGVLVVTILAVSLVLVPVVAVAFVGFAVLASLLAETEALGDLVEDVDVTVGASEDLAAWPHGVDGHVSERVDTLSGVGGERTCLS